MNITRAAWHQAVDAYVASLQLQVTRRAVPGTDVYSPRARQRNGMRATPADRVQWRAEARDTAGNLLADYCDDPSPWQPRRADALVDATGLPARLRALLRDDYLYVVDHGTDDVPVLAQVAALAPVVAAP